MSSTICITDNYSPTPWSYEYSPYTVSKTACSAATNEIPAFEVFDANGEKIFDTNEDSPTALQESNARIAVAAPELLLSLRECVRLLADFDTSGDEEGKVYRRAIAIIEQATQRV